MCTVRPNSKAVALAGDVQELTFATDGKTLMVNLILEKQDKVHEVRLEIRPQNQEP